MRGLAENISGIRLDMLKGRIPPPLHAATRLADSPLLSEMERTVTSIADVFAGSQSLSRHGSPRPSGGDPPPTVFVRDALSNPEHINFALKGCLAASPCYIINLEEFKIQTALRLQIVWHFSQDAWRRFSLSRTTENLTSSLEKELRESQAPVVHADLPAGPNHSGV